MPMSDGLTTSMWMRMPGHSWAGTATSFLVMWVAMMAAMMLPSLAPALWRYRVVVCGAGGGHVDRLVALVGAGYFAVWAAIGVLVFPLGVALAQLAAEQPALARVAPLAAGAAVLLAGVLQHSTWKARQLALCRATPHRVHHVSRVAHGAWRHGVRLGLHCVGSCAGLTAAGLLVGAMDLRVMAVVTTVITVERLAPGDARVVRAIGDVVVVAGLVLLARAVALGGQGL
jgi:predicted metal-binding membrane protein